MNIREIAGLAGVSVSTVSKIINHKDESISAETRERVLQIVKEYNYIPFASSISSSAKTFLLGLIVREDLSHSPFSQGVISEAQQNGYCVILCESRGSLLRELKNVLALCGSRVDGVVWEPVDDQSAGAASNLEEFKIPYRMLSAEEGAYNIDYEALGFTAAGQLVERGHSRVSCLLSSDSSRNGFLKGYKKCLFENNIGFEEELVFSGVSPLLLEQIGRRNITGIISADFVRMRELLEKLMPLQYRLPEDLSLLALKDQEEDVHCFPPVSCLTVPHMELGRHLCRALLQEIERLPETEEPFRPQLSFNHTASLGAPYNAGLPGITVVGSLNIDVYLNVSQLPFSGKTVSTSTSSTYPGGKGMNQAAGASKLGHRVNLIGMLGTDLDSDNIYAALKEYHINPAGVCRTPQEDTGKAYILVAPGGESMISILSGANSSLSPSDIRRQEHLFADSAYCLMQTEVPLPAIYEACLAAHKYGARTIVKPSACGQLPDEMLREIDILVPNEDEIREICPVSGSLEELTAYLLEKGISTVIVTLGGEGCYVHTGEWEEYFPAAEFPSVDNTGASDAFISALASYLMYGYELREAVRIAVYAAGFSIAREGVISSLIDKNRLETFVRQM